MSKRLLMMCAWLAMCTLAARAGALLEYQRVLTRGAHSSLSGQFVVYDIAPDFSFRPANFQSTNLMQLDPTLLTVSCERIKTSLLLQLGLRDAWTGKIFISLRHARPGDELVVVKPVRAGRDWMYQIEMPDRMERSRVISTLVEVMLLEIADRSSDHCTEIPVWLTQGMSREVMFGSELELVLEKPNHVENGLNLSRFSRTDNFSNPLAKAREDLQSVPPLTIEDLSWPKPESFAGLSGEAYADCAQLLVHDLLQLNDGRQCMRNFLAELPHYLNWQIAFLRAFRPHFATQREVEKWWALQIVQFTGRDFAQTWRVDESWQRLDELLRPSAEVRTTANELPMHTQITLQSILREWPLPNQLQAFEETSRQLLLLRLRVSQDLVYLADDYRRALDAYVKKRGHSAVIPYGKKYSAPPMDDLSKETIRTLDALDARRNRLRPNPQIAPAMTANVSANR